MVLEINLDYQTQAFLFHIASTLHRFTVRFTFNIVKSQVMTYSELKDFKHAYTIVLNVKKWEGWDLWTAEKRADQKSLPVLCWLIRLQQKNCKPKMLLTYNYNNAASASVVISNQLSRWYIFIFQHARVNYNFDTNSWPIYASWKWTV